MQCSTMSIFRKAYQYLQDLCTVWREEIIRLVKDEGVIIFFFLMGKRIQVCFVVAGIYNKRRY